MSECRGQYFSENSSLNRIALFNPLQFSYGIVLYEVVRVQEGICLFLEDHLERLQESIQLSSLDYQINSPLIQNILKELISQNGFRSGNIKIMVHVKPGLPPCYYTYFIPHFYPASKLYRQGVDTALFKTVRINPNVKIFHSDVRNALNRFMNTRKLYEVLLVNENEFLTEGSKSNVFFIQGQEIITPPAEQVLKGITRKKVFELCNQLNFKLIERSISTVQLTDFEAAFLSGTSPKILPIRKIGSIGYSPAHPIINSLTVAYNELLDVYIQYRLNAV